VTARAALQKSLRLRGNEVFETLVKGREIPFLEGYTPFSASDARSAIVVQNGTGLLKKVTIGPSFPAYFIPRHGAKRANTYGGISSMQLLDSQRAKQRVHGIRLRTLWQALLLSSFAIPAHAQQNGNSPWENAVNVLKTAFTGTIATGLSLVAMSSGA
jgi:hypothetical protein